MDLPTADQPMNLADALAYREQHRWRKIRPASLQAVDALGDEVERLRPLSDMNFQAARRYAVLITERDEELANIRAKLAALCGSAQEPRDDYPGKEDGA